MIATQERIDLKALKQSVDLLALVRSRGHEPIRHGSGKWKINCPFHDDQEASLVITPEKNLWHCMGCDKGGSPIDFIKESDHLTTGQAIRALAADLPAGGGKPLRPPEKPTPDKEPLNPGQQTLLNKVAAFYHKELFKYPEGISYLKERGLTEPALLETFKIGYATDTLRDAIPPEGDMLDDLQAIGILDNQGREHFRDCIVFPIHDHHGNVVEMYGRKIIEGGKVQHLYLPGAHAGIFNHVCARASSYLLLTESLIDAATLWQAGYKNVTALYGTNGLTQDHARLIQTHDIQRLYLVMDGDDAGRRGAERTAQKLKALGLDIMAVQLPQGHDPNSYFIDGGSVEKFDALLKAAKPVIASSSEPLREIPQSDITRKQGTAKIQDTPDGFRITFVKRTYDVRTIDAGPGKLKATIKALTEQKNSFHIDTVDLYSARSRKTFIADASKLFREEGEIIQADLNRIIEHLEAQAHKPEPVKQQIIQLTDKERRAAERLAKRKDLLDVITKDFHKCGYVGETANVQLAYLAMTSRKMKRPLAMLILSGSGSGKSALQDTACALCPDEDLVKLTSLTERALFYKGETSLQHKVLALEEAAGAEDAAYAIRSLISSGVLVIETTIKDQLTGRMTTVENKVYGPTSVLLTTTQPDIDPETLTRFIVTTIDESQQQTAKILEAQRISRTLDGFKLRIEQEAIYKKHHAMQRLLKPLHVVNPYGKLLTYNDEQLLTRRDHPKYLDLIETIAFLHQYRKAVKHISINGQAVDYIEADLSDITLANELATEILGKSLDELNGPSRRLLILTEKMVNEWAKSQNTEPHCIEFTRRQLREHTRWSDYQVRTHIGQLVDLEYLVPCGGRQGAEYKYRLYWDGQGRNGERFLLGLKPVEQIRKEAQLLGIER